MWCEFFLSLNFVQLCTKNRFDLMVAKEIRARNARNARKDKRSLMDQFSLRISPFIVIHLKLISFKTHNTHSRLRNDIVSLNHELFTKLSSTNWRCLAIKWHNNVVHLLSETVCFKLPIKSFAREINLLKSSPKENSRHLIFSATHSAGFLRKLT